MFQLINSACLQAVATEYRTAVPANTVAAAMVVSLTLHRDQPEDVQNGSQQQQLAAAGISCTTITSLASSVMGLSAGSKTLCSWRHSARAYQKDIAHHCWSFMAP